MNAKSIRNTSHVGAVLIALLLIVSLFVPVGAQSDGSPAGQFIVREATGAGDGPEALVEQLGGRVLQQIGVIGGFAAELPDGAATVLLATEGVVAVTPNAPLQLAGAGWDNASTLEGLDPKTFAGSLFMITNTSGAREMWAENITGEGIDVALIDSGVVPVAGLDRHAKIINGPDLSFESQSDELRYLDTFGHGTHLAGIIAGYDKQAPGVSAAASESYFLGVAPESRIVSIKVADHNGATDVSQVLAAIDWVVQHRTDNGLNIRVLNLSFGTNGVQDYVLDPLAFAVEQAWDAGIVVVVAAGNDGNGFDLRNPAYDPFVIAVGSHEGKDASAAKPDLVSDFSNCGDGDRSVDILARGRSVLSLRNPGSAADTSYPEATVADRFFLGSGTSQAAAVVSGAAALILDQRPELTPDQVKALLIDSSKTMKKAPGYCRGVGSLDLATMAWTAAPDVVQTHTPSTGTGSLEAARGDHNRVADGVVLEGEQDIFGNDWDGVSWSTASAQGVSWSGGDWNGVTWSGVSWSGLTWSGVSWSGVSWSGVSWSGLTWSGVSWSGVSWSGGEWSGLTWSGLSWSANSWSGVSWD